MVFQLYLNEIKNRIFYILFGVLLTFCVSFYYSFELYFVLAKPLINYLGGGNFIYTGLFEVMSSYIFLSFFISIIVLFIFCIYNFYMFLLPGLYKYTAIKYLNIFIFILSSSIFFCYFVYKFCLLFLYTYLIKLSGMSNNLDISFNLEPRVLEYIYFVLKSIFGLYFVSLVPLLFNIVVLLFFKNLEIIWVIRYVYYILITISIIIFLPPDFFLHLLVFFVIFCIFELFILFLFVFYEYYNISKDSVRLVKW